jgi:hypothetical protein
VADAFEKAVLVVSIICMVGWMVMFVRIMARRMVTEDRPSRRTLVMAGVFAVGAAITGVIRLFVL